MAKQFSRFQDMMSTALDKAWSARDLEGDGGWVARHPVAEDHGDGDSGRGDDVACVSPRVSSTTTTAPSPPHWSAQHHPPPVEEWSAQHHPPPATAGLDLNTVPGASSNATPPRPNSPMGHGDDNQIRDAGGGILGFPPPRPGNGTHYGPVPHPLPVQAPASDEDSGHHNPQFIDSEDVIPQIRWI